MSKTVSQRAKVRWAAALLTEVLQIDFFVWRGPVCSKINTVVSISHLKIARTGTMAERDKKNRLLSETWSESVLVK